MTEPSVEDIVADFEREGLTASIKGLRALVASWRKRGEGLTRIKDNDPNSWEAHLARAALKDKP